MADDNKKAGVKKPQMGLAGGAWARTHERVMAEMERARQERMKSRGYKKVKINRTGK